MSANTGVDWADHSWPWLAGCRRRSPGCDFCYAINSVNRLQGRMLEYAGSVHHTGERLDWTGVVHVIESHMDWPLTRFPKRPARIFVNSLAETFDSQVPAEAIARAWAVMALCPQHTFLVLSKVPVRMRSVLSSAWLRGLVRAELARRGRADLELRWPLPNVWVGVSAEDQEHADRRVPVLLETPAAVRWVSAEPLIGPIDFSRWMVRDRAPFDVESDAPDGVIVDGMERCGGSWRRVAGIDWIVAGGESTRMARPMHLDWPRRIRDACGEAGVPFYFKQHGGWACAPWRAPVAPEPAATLTERRDAAVRIAATHIVNRTGTVRELPGVPWSVERGEHTDPWWRPVRYVGKGAAGHVLDGAEHRFYPEPVAVHG